MSNTEPLTEEKRFTWREPVAVLAAIALVDATIYHGSGYFILFYHVNPVKK